MLVRSLLHVDPGCRGLTPRTARKEYLVTMLGLKRREEDPEETDLKALDAQDRLRSIIEQQPACLAEVAADGQVLAMNSAQVALMGAHRGGPGLPRPRLPYRP